MYEGRNQKSKRVSRSLDPLIRVARLAFVITFTMFDVSYAIYNYYSGVKTNTGYILKYVPTLTIYHVIQVHGAPVWGRGRALGGHSHVGEQEGRNHTGISILFNQVLPSRLHKGFSYCTPFPPLLPFSSLFSLFPPLARYIGAHLQVETWEVKLKIVSICVYLLLLLSTILWHLVTISLSKQPNMRLFSSLGRIPDTSPRPATWTPATMLWMRTTLIPTSLWIILTSSHIGVRFLLI